MKPGKRWPLHLLILVVGVLGIRLAWQLSRSEMGWSPHFEHWANFACRMIGVDQPKFSDTDPAEQAKFWLSEVATIGPAIDDPQLAMGAAWMLDSPQYGFLQRQVRLKKATTFPALPARFRRELDFETIAAKTDEFESACRDRCLAMVDRAVRLDAANPELRRAQALLLFRLDLMGVGSQPRLQNWLPVLDQCAQVDPHNALYDYLAALHLWKSSASYDWEDSSDGVILTVTDKRRFEQGNARLSAGLAKPYLKFGTDGYAAAFRFVDQTSLGQSSHLLAGASRQTDSRATRLLFRIMRWQGNKKEVEARAGRIDAAVDAVEHVVAISNQVTQADNYPNVLGAKLILRRSGLANLGVLSKDHPNLFSADKAASLTAQLSDVQHELKLLEEVGRRMVAKAGTSVTQVQGMTAKVPKKVSAVFAMVTAQMLVTACVTLALIFSTTSLLFRGNGDANHATLGWCRQVVAWLLAVSVSFLFLGMFPAEVVTARVQTWFVFVSVWIGCGLVCFGVPFLLRRRYQILWGEVLALLAVGSLPMITMIYGRKVSALVIAGTASLHHVLTTALILCLAMMCWASFHFLWKFCKNQDLTRRRKLHAVGDVFLIVLVAVPTAALLGSCEFTERVWISPTIWNEAQGMHIEPAELQQAMKMSDANWGWACIQWQAYHGHLVAPIIAVVIGMIWHLIRQSGRIEGGVGQILRSQKRNQLHRSGKSAAASCLVAALVFMGMYFAATPPVADMMDTYHSVYYTRLSQPDLAWKEVAEVTDEIKADHQTMAKLQAEIDERNRKIAEQNAWQE